MGPDHRICDHARAVRGRRGTEVHDEVDWHGDWGRSGYLLTARLEQQPILYLFLVGAIVGLGTAMFGYYQVSLCLPALRADHDGRGEQWHGDPRSPGGQLSRELKRSASAWSVGAGDQPCLAALRAQGIPGKDASGFGQLREALSTRSALLFEGKRLRDTDLNHRSFATVIAGMQNLLHFGALESQYFRARLPTFTEIIFCLSRISAAIETLVQTLPQPAPPLRLYLRAELEAAHAAITECLGVFADANADSRAGRLGFPRSMRAAHSGGRNFMLFAKPIFRPGSPWSRYFTFPAMPCRLRRSRRNLRKLNGLLDSLPADPLQPSREAVSLPSPPLDPFWIRNGVKACIAVTLGLFVQNWLKPPGGSMIVLATWVFTVLSRLYPGRPGDRRAFPLHRLRSCRRQPLRRGHAVPYARAFRLPYP